MCHRCWLNIASGVHCVVWCGVVCQCCYAVMLLPLCCLLFACSRRQLFVFVCCFVLSTVGLLAALQPMYGSVLPPLASRLLNCAVQLGLTHSLAHLCPCVCLSVM